MRFTPLLKITLGFTLLLSSLSGMAQTPDPGLMGTHAVLKGQYNLGDAAFSPPPAAMFSPDMEVRGSVHYPADLGTGPFPVLVWLHGRHSTCYEVSNPSNTSGDWPCPGGWEPIVSYEGYDYAARTMASHGYIVISISANSINANDAGLPDKGGNARGVLVQHHLDLWNDWSSTDTTGPFGSLFVGALDMQNVGTMGHSRGGEGVIFNAEYNRSLGSPYGINAVLTLAPIDQNRHVLNQTPVMNIAPYCDGDVYTLPGVYYYDDARFLDNTDEQPKHSVLVMGANHNFFNTVWTPGSYIAGGSDDWLYIGSNSSAYCGATSGSSGRLDTTTQKAIYNAYAAAFFRYYLGHETAFEPILNSTDIIPPASSLADSTQIFVSYHAGRTDRLDINTVDSLSHLTTNSMGGAVTTGPSLTAPAVCGGGLTMSSCDSGLGNGQKPHRGTASTKGLGQMRLKWTATSAYYENELPAEYQDLREIESLSFRACTNFSETSVSTINFHVDLIDSLGNSGSLSVNNYTNVFFQQPGDEFFVLPKVLFNTIRLPIADYSGVDLAHVRYVRFSFDMTSAAAILVSDLAFINRECGGLNVTVAYDSLSGLDYAFSSTVTVLGRDTVSLLWDFGDPSSGAANSSVVSNPTHTFTTDGSFNVCLYMTTHRPNGDICMDTVCNTVVVSPILSAAAPNLAQVQIYPNPAGDYLSITGADRPESLTLLNMVGQPVFSTRLEGATVQLPQGLAAGVYVAVVATAGGTAYEKLVVER